MVIVPSSVLQRGGGSWIVALLGPTNTGKTHRAIERMLWHRGGMIGLPLRLLAREVYERVVARVGESKTALLTGEERIVPPRASYWICTVESMPLGRAVPFLAVDEIQLAAHPKRGHVFTDRLLNARGTRETWFLGSDTMVPIIERLVPTTEIRQLERLSVLRHTKPRGIGSLPQRSAVIAFSISHVYELAEQIRMKRGGAAIVLGAMSPKARNAQVAMFESGEVGHLVSTDAIGMGLNLDIRNVYFGGLRKYDGTEHRLLGAAEVGQIAGRAGRFETDGLFGLTTECAGRNGFPPWMVEAVEQQSFLPLRKIYYRSSSLDFASADALRSSLRRKPFAGCLQLAWELSDERALAALLEESDISARVAGSPASLELLWEVCCVPDYRQGSESAHFKLLAQLFRQLSGSSGRISSSWISGRLRALGRTDGSIGMLLERIAKTRTWAFIAHREDWLDDPACWRAETLSIEESLSGQLHARISEQFVDERAQVLVRPPVSEGSLLPDGTVQAGTICLGRLQDFSFLPNPEAESVHGYAQVRRMGRQICLESAESSAIGLLSAPFSECLPDSRGRLCWRGIAFARLEKGPLLREPKTLPMPMELLPEPLRRKLLQHAHLWMRQKREALLSPLRCEGATGSFRGLLHLLGSSLGVLSRKEAEGLFGGIGRTERSSLAKMKIVVGREAIWSRELLRPRHQGSRAAFWSAWLGIADFGELPGGKVAVGLDWPDMLASSMGWPRYGPLCIRIDMAERVAELLRKEIPDGPRPLPAAAMPWLGCGREEWHGVAEAMGYRLRKEGVYPPRRSSVRSVPRRRR
jgi:ATP-dependent RNA helicase SUPV3L1/SUV3